MSKVAKWIFPAAGGKDGIVGTALAVVGFMTGNWGMVAAGAARVAGAGKKTQGQARQASVLSLTLGEAPREAVIGVTCTGGSLVDVFNFGGQYGTDKVTRCVALADHAIDGIVGFYVDDQFYPWVGEGLQAAFSNKLSFHFRNASADGYAPPQHVMESGGWVATDRMVGVTHIWIDWFVDEKVWPQGHPAIRFVLRGLRAYDPRFDPQFGYAGPNPQTWEDRSSHRFTRNAKVLRYAYTRGIYAEGHHGDPNYLLIGRGLTAEEAPPEMVIADANLCDEIVDGVARYSVGGVISASQPFIDVDGMFAAAMAGVIVQREGTVDVEAGQAKAVVVTITDDDLVVGEPVSFSRFLPDNDGGRINTVMGRYIEPSLGYKDHSAPVRRSLDDIQADGGPREQTVSLPLVDEVKQADRIIEIQRLLARLERRASIVLPPKFAGLEEGDWIAWQSNRRHGGATVRYRIETYRQPETWRMYLTLREIASSAFGLPDPIQDHVLPPPAPVPLDALALTGVTAEAITLAAPLPDPVGDGEAGPAPLSGTVPAIRFKWDVITPVDAAVRAIRAEVRVVGTDDVSPTRTEDVSKGVLVTTNGVGPNQRLEARLVPIGEPSRPVLASAWITLTTGDLIADGLAPDAAQELIDEALREVDGKVEEAAEQIRKAVNLDDLFSGQDDIAEAILKLGRGQTELQRIVETHTRDGGKLVKSIVQVIGGELENAQGAIVQEALLSLQRDLAEATLREALALQVGDNQATFQSAISGLVTDLSSEISARTALGVRVGSAEGAISSEATVRASADGVFTQNFTLLGARRGNGSGWILNQSTIDISGEGTLASVLSGLRAADGSASSAITTLQQASGSQASQLTNLSSTVGGHTSSIGSLFSVTNGLSARWTLGLNVDGVWTSIIADGASRSVTIAAEVFRVASQNGGVAVTPFVVNGSTIDLAGNVRVTGRLDIRSAASGPRLEQSNDAIRLYDANRIRFEVAV